MININRKAKKAINRNTILSLNKTDVQSIKNQNNIQTIMKQQQYHDSVAYTNQDNTAKPISNISDSEDKKMPKLQNSIQKGQKVALPISNSDRIEICFDWNTKNKRCDVDASAFLIGQNGKVLGDDWFLFYGQTISPDKSAVWTKESNECQKVNIDFSKLDKRVDKIVFVLTIDEAIQNQLYFDSMEFVSVRILNQYKKEITRFIATEYDKNMISMVIAELYCYHGVWKMSAVGNGFTKNLAKLCELYGVEVV